VDGSDNGPGEVKVDEPGRSPDSEPDIRPESLPYPPDIVQAIQDFQGFGGSRYENDYAVPLKLLPLLTEGLSQDEVSVILGPPDEVSSGDDWIAWNYILFYGMNLSVGFDLDKNLRSVYSPLLAEELEMPDLTP